MVTINSSAISAIASPSEQAIAPSMPVMHPSWTSAMTDTAAQSLKSAVNDMSISGLAGSSGNPMTVVPASVSRSFSSTFTPHPTYWITFGNYWGGQEINMPTGNFNVQLPAGLKF